MAQVGSFNERSITNFRDRLVGGGARSNMFEVNIELPTKVIGLNDYKNDIRFMVKAAEIPAANIGNIPIPFRGRILPVAGDRTFDPWTVTIINDQKFNIRDAMEQWSNKLMILDSMLVIQTLLIIKQRQKFINYQDKENHLVDRQTQVETR